MVSTPLEVIIRPGSIPAFYDQNSNQLIPGENLFVPEFFIEFRRGNFSSQPRSFSLVVEESTVNGIFVVVQGDISPDRAP